MIPGVNIRGKVRVAGLNKAGGALVGAPGGGGGGGGGVDGSETLIKDFRAQSHLGKLLGSKEHRD